MEVGDGYGSFQHSAVVRRHDEQKPIGIADSGVSQEYRIDDGVDRGREADTHRQRQDGKMLNNGVAASRRAASLKSPANPCKSAAQVDSHANHQTRIHEDDPRACSLHDDGCANPARLERAVLSIVAIGPPS